MDSRKAILFSDMTLGEATIQFEKEQLKLYTELVNRHPDSEYYKKAQSQLIDLISDHEKQLKEN